jgi:hypothetical protein
MNVAKVTKRLTTFLLPSVLVFALLSLISLRQVAVRTDFDTGVDQSADNITPGGFAGTFLVSTAPEDTVDLEKLAAPPVRIQMNTGDFVQGSRQPFWLQRNPPPGLPSYILQSVLNL